MSTIQFIQLDPEQLLQQISHTLKTQLDALLTCLESKQPDEYLTRVQVAALFKVNVSTINNWVKSGKLKQYGIGNRVYFLKSDLEEALTLLNPNGRKIKVIWAEV
ncbi:helix-turn-helix domain-containing protein [Flavobacterium sp.]|uniref:helix-turn-helix domain-containing protein n=1 Tax=Flavobacterium sp. TaxID=239 RepID=UPI004033ABF6